jgi:putative two-component system response regulator
MIHINKLTDYALIILAEMKQLELVSAKKISEKNNIPLATTNKILRQLTQANICASKNGKTGGFFLVKKPEEISILDVINCFEQVNTSFAECSLSHNSCHLHSKCKITKKMQSIHQEITNLLHNKKISDLIN